LHGPSIHAGTAKIDGTRRSGASVFTPYVCEMEGSFHRLQAKSVDKLRPSKGKTVSMAERAKGKRWLKKYLQNKGLRSPRRTR
jgi:hypothetical protein